MASLPGLSDPEVAGHTLMLGFSFSLEPDGSPGIYNQCIAQSMLRDIEQYAGKQSAAPGVGVPGVGVQWEIADAIDDELQSGETGLSGVIRNEWVSKPPEFRAEEVDYNGFMQFLKDSTAVDARHSLLIELENLAASRNRSITDSNQLVFALNALLDDQQLFQKYPNTPLSDLVRSRALLTELRCLPASRQYPEGLRRYQSMRINRLIVESIIRDKDILKRGRYLSTDGVLDFLLPKWQRGLNEPRHILIYAHPLHSARCRRQTIARARHCGWSIPDDSVQAMHAGESWPWDAQTAQTWCRSEAQWREYEQLVARLRHDQQG